MATRRTSRPTARQRRSPAHAHRSLSLYRRALRYEPLEDRRLLATVTVTTLADTIDFNDGVTSLREALFATNLVTGPDTIDFAPSLTASGPATMLLTQGELAVTDSLTIDGPGANLLTIDASGNDPTPDVKSGDGSRIFNVDDGTANLIEVSLVGLELTGGDTQLSGGAVLTSENLTIQQCQISGNSAGRGGGVSSRYSNLTIEASVVSNNRSNVSGGGIDASARDSQAINIRDTVITGNSTSATGNGRGGGAYLSVLNKSSAVITRTSMVNNSAHRDGGGLYFRASSNSAGQIESSTFSGNSSAARGGGLALSAGQSQIVVGSTTVDHNTGGTGGGIAATIVGGTVTITNSTISGNTSANVGGLSISSDSPDNRAILQHSTVTDNSATGGSDQSAGGIRAGGQDLTLEIDHSIVAGNRVTTGANADLLRLFSLALDAVNSLVGDSMGSGLAETLVGIPDTNGNLIGGPVHGVIDPLLGPLADNGGPTLTHALLPGSPAINAGDLNFVAGVDGVPLFDQRGEPFDRIVNGRIDIGAFEYQEPSDLNLLVDTLADESDGNYSRGDLSLREAIELANLWPSDDTIRFDPALTTAGPATILLTMGELKITDDLTINGPGAERLTIDASGNDPTPTIDDGQGTRIFNIYPFFEASFRGLMLTGGDSPLRGGAIFTKVAKSITIQDSVITGNATSEFGGGVYASNTVVLIESTTISNNIAMSPGSPGKGGGGLFIRSADLTVRQCVISGNSAYSGGGLYFDGYLSSPGRELVVANTILSGNRALAEGGGVWIRSNNGAITITDSVITQNVASKGGGVYNFGGSVDITDTEISENKAYGGHGISARNSQLTITNSHIVRNSPRLFFIGTGGGISAEDVALMLAESVVSENIATQGAGINLLRGGLTIRQSTISGNVQPSHNLNNNGAGINARSAAASITGTIVSGNQGGAGMYLLSTGTTTIANSEFSDNSYGGIRLRQAGPEATIVDSVVTGNGFLGILVFGFDGSTTAVNRTIVTGNEGTGINIFANGNATTTISDSTVLENSGGIGGGIRFSTTGPGSLLVTRSTISGNSASLRGGGIYLNAGSDGSATISDSTITGNSITFPSSSPNPDVGGGGIWIAAAGGVLVSNCEVSGNSSTSNGGGIVVNSLSGSLTPTIIRGCEITNNTAAFYGGGVRATTSQNGPLIEDCDISQNTAQAGGGIYAQFGGTLSISHTKISKNVAQISSSMVSPNGAYGGGIYAEFVTLNVTDCVIDQNTAQKDGGGIFNISRPTNILQTTISNNHATSGGGILADGGFDIRESTINGNTATAAGGGIRGGGTITQSTISNNTADIGGGIYTSSLKLHHSTVAFNRTNAVGAGVFLIANSLQLNHSIVAQNTSTAPGGSGDVSGLLGTTITALYSLIGNSNGSGLTPAPVGSPDANGNLIGGTSFFTQINPQLAPLADNGGSTLTHALLPNSPAINAGDPAAIAGVNGVPAYDQRGAPFTRVSGGQIDVGAFEVQPTPIDFNYDGFVDVADYVMWRKVMTTTFEEGYGIWTTHFGESVGGAGTVQADQVLVIAPSTALAEPVSPAKPAILRQGESAAIALAAPVTDSRVSTNKVDSRLISHAKAFREVRARDAALIVWLGQRGDVRRGDEFESESVMGGDADDEVVNFAFDSIDAQNDLQSHDAWIWWNRAAVSKP